MPRGGQLNATNDGPRDIGTQDCRDCYVGAGVILIVSTRTRLNYKTTIRRQFISARPPFAIQNAPAVQQSFLSPRFGAN